MVGAGPTTTGAESPVATTSPGPRRSGAGARSPPLPPSWSGLTRPSTPRRSCADGRGGPDHDGRRKPGRHHLPPSPPFGRRGPVTTSPTVVVGLDPTIHPPPFVRRWSGRARPRRAQKARSPPPPPVTAVRAQGPGHHLSHRRGRA